MKRRVLFGLAVALAALPATASAVDMRTVSARQLILSDARVPAGIKSSVRNPVGGSGALTRRFGDVTRDGRPDLIVSVASGGTAGDIAYYVYAEVGGRIRDIRAENDGYKVFAAPTARGNLMQRDSVYAAADPNCCPSAARIRVFRWNGTGMAVVSDRRVALTRP